MSLHLKIVSATATALLLAGAFIIGGGAPLSPAEIADATSAAADNSKIAAENTTEAARATLALADIADDVRSQLDSSQQLLEVQLGLEDSSRRGAERAAGLEREIASIGRELSELERAASSLSGASQDAGEQVNVLANSAADLERALAALEDRFDRVVRESRELNRKARGFSELRDVVP
jgi:chromosome segregation ATPase